MTTRVAFITGSAKRLGAGTAQYLHSKGFNIVLHCHRSQQQARVLKEQLNYLRADSACLLEADLTDLSQLAEVARMAIDSFGRLDVLINNASSFYPTEFGSIEPQDWQSLVGSNMQGPLFLTQHLYKQLAKNQGVVINMLDIHAQRPLKGHTVYCMAKAGLHAMTVSLAQELAPDIRVNGVAPGAILWPEHQLLEEEKQQILSQIPLGRLGTKMDIAQAIEFLINADYVTGQVLNIDGGRSIQSQAKA